MAVSVAYWAVYWIVFVYGISSVPDAMQLLTATAYLVGGAALLVSPDAAAGPPPAELAALGRAASGRRSGPGHHPDARPQQGPLYFFLGRRQDLTGYLVLSAALAVVTVALVVVLKLSWYFLLLLAALFYPYAMQLAFSGVFRDRVSSTNLLRLPTPGHLTVLFVPPVLLACAVLLIAAWSRRPSRPPSAARRSTVYRSRAMIGTMLIGERAARAGAARTFRLETPAMTDYTTLPDNLPVPEDDGAADHLAGLALPALPCPPATAAPSISPRSAPAGRSSTCTR